MGSGDLVVPERKPVLYTATTLNTASGTTPVLLLTGTPYYYLTRLLVSVDPNCTMTGGGMISATFTDSVFGTVGQIRFYAPASFTAPSIATVAPILESGTGYYFNSTSSGSTLTVALNTALTGGSVRLAVNYGLTSYTA